MNNTVNIPHWTLKSTLNNTVCIPHWIIQSTLPTNVQRLQSLNDYTDTVGMEEDASELTKHSATWSGNKKSTVFWMIWNQKYRRFKHSNIPYPPWSFCNSDVKSLLNRDPIQALKNCQLETVDCTVAKSKKNITLSCQGHRKISNAT